MSAADHCGEQYCEPRNATYAIRAADILSNSDLGSNCIFLQVSAVFLDESVESQIRDCL
jgi:hypothetical protein